MELNNATDEELMFDQEAALRLQKAQEIEKRIADVQALTDEQKNDRILDLEDDYARLEQECDKLEDENARLKSDKFKWSLGCLTGLIALSGAVYALIVQDGHKQSYHEQIQTLENELRTAAWLDEANSKLIRNTLVKEVIAAAAQNADVTPSEAVEMAIAHMKEQKSQGNLAVENFQIRVIGQDLRTLAMAAEATKTNTQNFLKAVAVYALNRPNVYAQSATPVGQSRSRIDNLLIKAGRENKINSQN